MSAFVAVELSSGWELKRSDNPLDEWRPVRRVPTEVHVDLLANGDISDPFVDLNELSARWVAEHSWTYRTTFTSPELRAPSGVRVDLVFKGLDTFAVVTLNGTEILKSDNMFVENRCEVGHLLKGPDSQEKNTLSIRFEPAHHRGLELVKAHPEHQFIVHQTDVSRGPVRKAQYHWGWDWGPILLTCGPWKPIVLETYTTRIDNARVDHNLLEKDLSRAQVSVTASVSGYVGVAVEACVSLRGQRVAQVALEPAHGEDGEDKRNFAASFTVEKPELWWPHGYGPQPLYDVEVRVLENGQGSSLAKETKRIGFRRAELIQEKDNFGQSFYFRVNNVDIFTGGSCWIPAESFLTRLTPEKYYDWVKLARDGNQTMIRVWGGGVYEADAFFHACDELGVLAWQDFAFACANYPAYPDYLQSVEAEARQNVRRLRHHPSLIVWAGNNEDYQIVDRYGLEYNFEGDKDPQSWLKTNFPARYLYEYLLPKVVAEESPGTAYHPSSPWGNGTTSTLKVDPTVGDVHQWNVWHGEMRPLQNLPEMSGRFVSEFGMEAYPHVETLNSVVSDPAERHPGSATMDFHNKAIGHERRLVSYVAENFRLRTGGGLSTFAHLTQVMQADAMAWAYKSWRRQWGRPGSRRCGGVLVWQLNDCWPTVSWAVADYHLVRKPAFYAIRRAMQPLAIAVTRKFHSWTMRPADRLWKRDTGHMDPTAALRDVQFDVWVSSSRVEPVRAEVVVRFISIESGRDVKESLTKTVTIEPNGSTEVYVEYSVEHSKEDAKLSSPPAPRPEPYLIYAVLRVDGKEISVDTSWPDPIKYLHLTNRGVKLQYNEAENSVEVSADKPVKGFVFSEKKGIELSDNGFDIIPGELPLVVAVGGIKVRELEWTFVEKDQA